MKRSTLSLAGLSATAALAMASLGAQVVNIDTLNAVSQSSSAKPMKGTVKNASSPEQRAAWLRVRATSKGYGYGRPGWSVKAGQRMARKRRNVARNRRQQRG